jgi:hypothetical protein
MSLQLSVERSFAPSGGQSVRLGHELLDDYLTFLAGRSRPNSVLAAAFDLKVFFCFAQKEPAQITSRDVLNFNCLWVPRIPSITPEQGLWRLPCLTCGDSSVTHSAAPVMEFHEHPTNGCS